MGNTLVAEADEGGEVEDPCERLGTRWDLKTWSASV
jgi:hypothetical protein